MTPNLSIRIEQLTDDSAEIRISFDEDTRLDTMIDHLKKAFQEEMETANVTKLKSETTITLICHDMEKVRKLRAGMVELYNKTESINRINLN